jgi:hypothetical protein
MQQVTLNPKGTQEVVTRNKRQDESLQTAEPPSALADAAPLAP